jgi:uncharacterized protein (TIGR00369 family)
MAVDDAHFRRCERMYHSAPVNAYFKPTISVGHGTAVVEIEVRPDFYHAAGAVHGAVYFKLLDDASFFAAQSLVEDTFVLTGTYTVTLLKPVREGLMRAEGKWTRSEGRRLYAEAEIRDGQGLELARGNGVFVRSRIALAPGLGY